MITLNTTSRLLVYFIGSMVLLSCYLSERLNKRGYHGKIRFISYPASAASFLLLIVTALKSSRLLDSYFYHDPITSRKVFWIIIDWLTVALFLFVFRKFWLNYILHDEKTILAGWYVEKYLSSSKKRKYVDAYQYLQKAAEISPDSVFVWCALAYLNELIFKKPDQCDYYLAKAKQVLDSSDSLSLKGQAVFEHYIGSVLQYRGHLQEGLEHLKKAYNLDPSPYRKEEYERAVELMNENTSDYKENSFTQ